MSNDRRALYRAGIVLQQLYCTYSRYTWTWPIERIKKRGNKWEVFYGEEPRSTSPIIPFPDALFPNAQDKVSILAWRGCNDAVAYLHIATKGMLKDIYIQVEEVTVEIKNARLTIMEHLRDDMVMMFPMHNVLRVTLRNSEVCTLDMTAAQYGWHGSAVMPWQRFCGEHGVERIYEVRSLGKTAEKLRAAAQVVGGNREIYQGWNEVHAENVNRGLSIWQQASGTSLKDMLRFSYEEFKTKQDSLLGYMRELISSFEVNIQG